MKKLLFFGLAAVALAACSKDKFKTEPQVEITSFGPSEVIKGNLFQLTGVVTDKEGDIQDSLKLVRKRFNGTTLLTTDTVRFDLSKFSIPNKTQAEIQVTFSYGEIRDGYIFQNLENVDRGLVIGVILEDKAGNRSEYKETERITLKRL